MELLYADEIDWLYGIIEGILDNWLNEKEGMTNI